MYSCTVLSLPFCRRNSGEPTINNLNDSVNLQKDLELLQQWEAQLDMECNSGTLCQVLYITRARTPLKYTVHNQTSENVSSARYLAVDVSTNLKFNNVMSKQSTNVTGTWRLPTKLLYSNDSNMPSLY